MRISYLFKSTLCCIFMVFVVSGTTLHSIMRKRSWKFMEANTELLSEIENLNRMNGAGVDTRVNVTNTEWTVEFCSESIPCPPWFYCDDNSNSCKCGRSYHHTIYCNESFQLSAVLDCYCVTLDEKTNKIVTGACFYNCESTGHSGFDPVYHPLPKNISQLNRAMCGDLKRTGPLCGQCINGFYPPVYSYDLRCVGCPSRKKNWWKFIVAAFLPLTIFYFFVLFFKLNANSSFLHAFVLFSQAISTPALVRAILRHVEDSHRLLTTTKVLTSLYGIWNLDFFRNIIPNICLQTDTLQTLALDYAIAVYPLFLMIVSYVFIELHDRNFRIVVFVWRPFRFILTFFRRNWDSRTSVIDAYATFFVLSFMKFLSVSFDLLVPTPLHELNSDTFTYVLYYDGSIRYFSEEHLPYAILALMILFFFIVLPVSLLLLYPVTLFQKFLNCLPVRLHILHTFVDSFQGCYKDGTEPGTRDCRWFSALFLLCRILAFLIFSVVQQTLYFHFASILVIGLVIAILVVHPFKARFSHYTKLNVTFLLLLVLFYITLMGVNSSAIKGERFFKTLTLFTGIACTVPLLVMSCAVIHYILSRRKWGKEFYQRIKAWCKGYDVWELSDDECLADRIINPEQYETGSGFKPRKF